MRTCTKCGLEQPLSEFYKDKRGPAGLSCHCKTCIKQRVRTWRSENLERARAFDRQRRPERRDAVKDGLLRRKYGITLEDYNALLAAQGGVCAICGGTEPIKDGRAMAVDHDHRTGKVRGILCSSCNRAIGLFGDRPVMVLRAMRYLIDHHQPA